MNQFFVPQLGSMIATMNGMVTQLYLQADHVGEYYGQSAQFSGDGFSDMHFTVRAVAAEEFARWLDGARSTGSALDRDAYSGLSRQSRHVRAFTYRAVEPGLFQAIVTQQIPPGPGPSAGSGQDVRPIGGK
jgi:cytochrome o ubiquinol oxidase subunit 2